MTEWRLVPRDGQRDLLGEGALWSARAGAFFWVDILAPALNRLVLDTGAITRWDMPEPIGWVVERASGGFIAGLRSGFAELDLDPLRIRPFCDPEPDLPGNRMNDAAADETGAIWCGTMDMAEAQDSGALYRLAPDRALARADSGYRVPNGPAFSGDGRWLFHSDTARRTVYRFARRGDALADRRDFITFTGEMGYPDGMTVDAEDHLWIAHWGGARVSRFRPDGALDRSIGLPARQVTKLAFCGERLDRLFVTSAATGLDPSETDGALFELDPGVRGRSPGWFAG